MMMNHDLCFHCSYQQWYNFRNSLATKQSNSSQLNHWELAPMELSTRLSWMTYPVLVKSSTPPSFSPMTQELWLSSDNSSRRKSFIETTPPGSSTEHVFKEPLSLPRERQGVVTYMSPVEAFATTIKFFDRQKVCLIAWSLDRPLILRSNCSRAFLIVDF